MRRRQELKRCADGEGNGCEKERDLKEDIKNDCRWRYSELSNVMSTVAESPVNFIYPFSFFLLFNYPTSCVDNISLPTTIITSSVRTSPVQTGAWRKQRWWPSDRFSTVRACLRSAYHSYPYHFCSHSFCYCHSFTYLVSDLLGVSVNM